MEQRGGGEWNIEVREEWNREGEGIGTERLERNGTERGRGMEHRG